MLLRSIENEVINSFKYLCIHNIQYDYRKRKHRNDSHTIANKGQSQAARTLWRHIRFYHRSSSNRATQEGKGMTRWGRPANKCYICGKKDRKLLQVRFRREKPFWECEECFLEDSPEITVLRRKV